MAPFYRLTLFVFACIAYCGGTFCFSGSAVAKVENETQHLTDTNSHLLTLPLTAGSDLERSALSWQIAQNTPEKPPAKDSQKQPSPKKSSFRFPSRMLLLGVGALVITVGAILILIRLISPPNEDEGTVVDIEAQTVPEKLPEPQKIQSSPSPQVKAITQGQMQVAPTVIQPEQPATPVEQNGYRDTTLQASNPNTPSDKPTTPENPLGVNIPVTDTVNIHPTSYGLQLDPQEQWINDLKQTNPEIRSNAIWELAQRGDSRAIQPLLELLIYSDSNQRSLVLAALSEIGTRTLKPLSRALSLSLQDENAEVRKNAIRDLTRIYDLAIQMNQILQRATDDPDPEVKELAKWATNRLSRLRSVSTHDEPPS